MTGARSGPAARRVMVGAAGGAVAAALAVMGRASWSVAGLVAEDVAALVFLVWVWSTIATADAPATSRLARTEDASRAGAEAVLIGAGAGSLLSVVFMPSGRATPGRPAAGS